MSRRSPIQPLGYRFGQVSHSRLRDTVHEGVVEVLSEPAEWRLVHAANRQSGDPSVDRRELGDHDVEVQVEALLQDLRADENRGARALLLAGAERFLGRALACGSRVEGKARVEEIDGEIRREEPAVTELAERVRSGDHRGDHAQPVRRAGTGEGN